MKIKYYAVLLIVFSVISQIFVGCVPAKQMREKTVITSSRLIKKIEANRRKIRTFSATGILNIESPEFSGKGNFEVILKKPDSIRVSIYGPFGIDLAQILVTKSDFIYYDVLKNKVYKGENRNGILKSILKIDLSFNDLIDVFAGSVNLTDKLTKEPQKYKQEQDKYIFSYINKNTGLRSQYIFRVDDLAIENYNLYDKNLNQVFEAQYSKFKLFNNVPIPYKSVIENQEKEQKIVLDYRKIKVNSKIQDMKIELPRDAKIVKW